MTGWYLRIGYISGYSFGGDAHEAWFELVFCVQRLRMNTGRIIGEIQRLNAALSVEEIRPFAELYAANSDLTLRIRDTSEDRCIVQLASGAGTDRMMKELARRAFCRLVIEEMHHRGIDVCMEVA